MTRLALAAVVLASGCLRPAAYQCSSDPECTQAGVQGRCEAVGFCSFPDTSCDSGHRFGDASGSNAQQCVGSGGDAGHDGGVTDGLGCPAGYAALGGISNRLYRKLPTAAAWMNQVTACTGEGANVYLAFPADAAELTAITTLAGANVWIGVSDSATEGTFLTVLGGTPYVPWSAGEPDNAGNQDCVEATSTGEVDTLTCSSQRIAVCECEP